jgi:hypothetical protein
MDTEPNGPGGGSEALRQQLHVLKNFLESFDLANLRPDGQTVKHATGTIPRVLSNPGHEYAMYFDGDGPTKVTLNLPAGDYSGAWVNIKSGGVERVFDVKVSQGAEVLESPDFKNGIALRLTRASK